MLAVTELDPNVILVAFIGGLFGIWQVFANRKTRDKIEQVHGEVRTNHGRRAGDYLEDISKVLNSQAVMTGRLDDLSAKVKHLDDRVDHLDRKIDMHTDDDARRFQQSYDQQDKIIDGLSKLTGTD